MKNEGRIMTGEAGGKEIRINMNNIDTKGEHANKQNEESVRSNKIAVKNIPPHNNMQETKSGKQGDEIRILTKDGEEKVIKITPEMDRKLKNLHNFNVEIDVNGEQVIKTAFDVLYMMGSLKKEGLTPTEVVEKAIEIKMLRDRLEEKYYAGSTYGNELRSVFGDKVAPGIDVQIPVDQINVKNLIEQTGGKVDDKNMEAANKLLESFPLPDGVKAVTISKDGKLIKTPITPAPKGEETGQVAPAPKGEEKNDRPDDSTKDKQPSKTTGSSNSETPTRIVTTEEKKKLEWEKWASGFLFLLILYMGAQGWYAKMWEQMAERAR